MADLWAAERADLTVIQKADESVHEMVALTVLAKAASMVASMVV